MIQREKRLGPKPTPRWYWRWVAWRLGHGYAKGHPRQHDLRPRRAPRRIPYWSWRRLHFFLLARAVADKRQRVERTPRKPKPKPKPSAGVAPKRVDGYEQAISYARKRPPFKPTRTIDVASASAFETALSNLRAGDYVKATAPFTVGGETIISNRLSSPAVLDLGSYVTFSYPSGSNVPAVYLSNPANLRIYGGSVTTGSSGGGCILSHGMQDVLWWGFYVHDCGGTGVSLFPVGQAITGVDLQGEVARSGENLAWDPHAEKGTGIHAVNLDDDGTHAFSGNRFAFYIHDQPSGAGITYGSATTYAPQHNTIYEKAVNLTDVALQQTGGNGFQVWGINGMSADIKFLEVDNAQGRAFDANGLYDQTSGSSGVTVEYGRASNASQNTRMNEPSPSLVWDRRGGTRFIDVAPAR